MSRLVTGAGIFVLMGFAFVGGVLAERFHGPELRATARLFTTGEVVDHARYECGRTSEGYPYVLEDGTEGRVGAVIQGDGTIKLIFTPEEEP